MSGKGAARVRYHAVHEFHDKVLRVHGLVEQYATARDKPDDLLQPIGRAFARLKTLFLGAGLDNLSHLCASMEIAARRGHSRVMKVRILRDTVASIRMQLDVEMRGLLAQIKAEEEKEKEEKEKEKS
jgi:chemotaxis protein histidine kinase CheA